MCISNLNDGQQDMPVHNGMDDVLCKVQESGSSRCHISRSNNCLQDLVAAHLHRLTKLQATGAKVRGWLSAVPCSHHAVLL
jgi:hypothetical protein